MSTEREEITVVTCDGCGAQLMLPDGEAPVGWFQGTVLHHHGGGGDGGAWDACRRSCVSRAVLAVADGD